MKCIKEETNEDENRAGGKRSNKKEVSDHHVCNKRLENIRHNSICAPYTKRKRLLESWIKKDDTTGFVEKMGTINSEVNKF